MTRLALLAFVAVLVTGCASAAGVTGAPSTPEASQGRPSGLSDGHASNSPVQPSPIPTASVRKPSPRPTVYTVPDGEVQSDAKQLAAHIVQMVTTYEVGTRPSDLAARVTTDPVRQVAVTETIDPLVQPNQWSRGFVVYPQLGGLSRDRISVMVLVEQRRGWTKENEVQTVTRTFDVRLTVVDGTWAFDELASIGGNPVPRPGDLSQVAQDVLDDPRIELPDSARWDIHARRVSGVLLEALHALAERTSFGVVTLSNGHPFNVLDTDRQSNHTRGLAVDIYRIGDGRVVDDRQPLSATHELVTWLYELPSLSEVGSPWALDGYGGRSFTDAVHQDHVHVGVRDKPVRKQ